MGEARDAANPTMRRTASTTKDDPAQTSAGPLERNPAPGLPSRGEGVKRKSGFRNPRGEERLSALDREFLIKKVHFGGGNPYT